MDWDRSRWIQIDLVLGTLFDVMIHAMNSVLLIQHFTSIEALLITLAFDAILLYVVLFNPKLAWANPSQIPSWVQRRLKPLSGDERQEIQILEKIGGKLNLGQM